MKQLSPSLNRRQLQALQNGSPTASDILDNEDYMDELNSEIDYTYGEKTSKPTEVAVNKSAPSVEKQESTRPVVKREVRKLKETPMNEVELDPEAELERMNKLAEATLRKKDEELTQKQESASAPEISPEEALRGQILGALNGHKEAPSEAQIAKWKLQYGDNGIYVIALNESDVFVFTYLRRSQWQKIQQTVANAQKAELTQNADDMMKEKVLQFTVLWPRPLTIEFFANSRAGTIDTLFNVIMANSSFLQLQQAMILTTQL